MKVDIFVNFGGVLCKMKFDVMGICCLSEVLLIKKLLVLLIGVEDVFVNVIVKIVFVLYDLLLILDV